MKNHFIFVFVSILLLTSELATGLKAQVYNLKSPTEVASTAAVKRRAKK